MEYLAMIHNTDRGCAAHAERDAFYRAAKNSGMFRGGSAIGDLRMMLGQDARAMIDGRAGGFMKFECDDVNSLVDLLKLHPVLIHGGTIELVDCPKS